MTTAEVVSPVAAESLHLWIDPETGAIVTSETEGAVKIDKWDVEVPPGAEAQVAEEDFSWLPAWFLRRNGNIAGERATLMSQYKKKMLVLDAIDKHMIWQWHDPMSKVVAKDIEEQRGKKKSFDYLEGRAGFRKGKKCKVTDEEEAKAWAHKHCPEAIKISEFLRVSYLPTHETDPGEAKEYVDVPGVERWEEETFFAKGNVAKEEGGDE